MNQALRTFALTIGVLSIAACSKDERAVEDVLAEDSTLALEVLSAKGDSIAIPTDSVVEPGGDTAAPSPATSGSAIASSTPAPSTPSTSITSREVAPQSEQESRAKIEPRRITRRLASASRRITRRSSSAKQVARLAPAAEATVLRPTIEATPLKSSAMLPAGTELSLTADQRVCASMSRIGDTFATRIANDVVGPIGVVIPKGTAALASISSVKNDLDVDMKSIALAGQTYAVTSDVTYTEVEKVRRKSSANKSRIAAGAGIGAVAGGVIGGNPATTVLGAAAGGLAGAVTTRRPVREDRCVPEGGRIDIKLVEPLKVALSS